MEATIGIALGTLAFIVMGFGPIVLVKKLNVKARHPKTVFVEPTRVKQILLAVAGFIPAAIIGMTLLTLIELAHIEVLTDKEGVVGSMLTMWIILFIIFSPAIAYTLNAHLRYRRIVEYGSPEWKKIHKK